MEIIQPPKQKFLQVFGIDMTKPAEEVAKDLEAKLTEMWENQRGIERTLGSPNVLLVVTAPRTKSDIVGAMPMPQGFRTQ